MSIGKEAEKLDCECVLLVDIKMVWPFIVEKNMKVSPNHKHRIILSSINSTFE